MARVFVLENPRSKHIHRIGDVWRNDQIEPFGDAVVTVLDDARDCTADLCRAYMYASRTGSAPLVGYETLHLMPLDQIEKHWRLVDKDKTR